MWLPLPILAASALTLSSFQRLFINKKLILIGTEVLLNYSITEVSTVII